MKSEKNTRTYSMTNRSRSAAETTARIIRAVGDLWMDSSLHEITLEAVAERSGVNVRTILRKFGSREGLFDACLQYDTASIIEERSKAPAGRIEEIVHVLLNSYESMGEAALRTIYLEPESEVARAIGRRGLEVHRDWCERVFAPFLPEPAEADYETRLAAFMSATEVYLWKLLRKDLGFSKDRTEEVFSLLLEGLVCRTKNK